MKKTLFSLAILFFLIDPSFTFAYSYNIEQIYPPVQIAVSFLATDDEQNGNWESPFYCVYMEGVADLAFSTGPSIAIETENTHVFTFSVIPGQEFGDIAVIGQDTSAPCSLENTDGDTDYLYVAHYGVDSFTVIEAPTPPTYTPPHFSLVSSSTSLIAAVGGSVRTGVQTTGASLWPLFVFLGVAIAFIIALQLSVFTKRTVDMPKQSKKSRGYPKGHPDYKAYRKGRRIIEKELPGFFDE